MTLGVYVREARWAHNFLFTIMIIASQIAGAIVGMLLASLSLRLPQDGEYVVPDSEVPLLLPSTITADEIKS